jgi:hypothetical protein
MYQSAQNAISQRQSQIIRILEGILCSTAQSAASSPAGRVVKNFILK